jgi:hypothetical protein
MLVLLAVLSGSIDDDLDRLFSNDDDFGSFTTKSHSATSENPAPAIDSMSDTTAETSPETSEPVTPFWTTASGIGTIVGIVIGTGVLVLVVAICWIKRRAEGQSDESGTWRNPLRYSIDTDLIDA